MHTVPPEDLNQLLSDPNRVKMLTIGTGGRKDQIAAAADKVAGFPAIDIRIAIWIKDAAAAPAAVNGPCDLAVLKANSTLSPPLHHDGAEDLTDVLLLDSLYNAAV